MGIQQMLLAGGGGILASGTITYPSVTSGSVGWSSGVQGSIVITQSWSGVTLGWMLSTPPSQYDFWLECVGFYAQNIFNNIKIEDSTGAIRTYTSASAVYSSGGNTSWAWGNGTNPAFPFSTSRSNQTYVIS